MTADITTFNELYEESYDFITHYLDIPTPYNGCVSIYYEIIDTQEKRYWEDEKRIYIFELLYKLQRIVKQQIFNQEHQIYNVNIDLELNDKISKYYVKIKKVYRILHVFYLRGQLFAMGTGKKCSDIIQYIDNYL